MDSTQHIRGVPDWDWPRRPHARLEARAAAIAARPFLPSVARMAWAERVGLNIANLLRTVAGK